MTTDSKRSAFSGQAEFETDGTPYKATIDIPNLPANHPLRTAKDRPCRALAGVGFKSGGGYCSCEVYLGGEIDVPEKEFWSGEAHDVLVNHLGKLGVEVIQKLEKGWIPPESTPTHHIGRGE